VFHRRVLQSEIFHIRFTLDLFTNVSIFKRRQFSEKTRRYIEYGISGRPREKPARRPTVITRDSVPTPIETRRQHVYNTLFVDETKKYALKIVVVVVPVRSRDLVKYYNNSTRRALEIKRRFSDDRWKRYSKIDFQPRARQTVFSRAKHDF